MARHLISGAVIDASAPLDVDVKQPVETNPAPAALVLLHTSGTLLGANGAEASGWKDISTKEELKIYRTAAGGTYALEVDWSRDGAAADVTEVITSANNTSAVKKVVAPFVRLRVRNTDAVTAFTAHRTTVYAR